MRFTVTYRIRAGDLAEARARADAIALEQTVEIPRAVVPPGYIEDDILGRVEETGTLSDGVFQAKISYSPDSAGEEFSQFLNVVFGNSSIQQGIRVTGVEPGETMLARFPGPRFGIKGIRARCGRATGGMIAPVLKPMGQPPAAFAALAAGAVRGGADIIKEDHGLAGQDAAPFEARVEAVAKAVAVANAEYGRNAIYIPNLSGRADQIEARLRFARDAGAGGVIVMPGLLGFGMVHRIAQDPGLDLPVMTHPSFLGPWVLNPDTGMDHGVVFGTLPRLAGADISVFPNVGGRFGFSAADCLQIAEACRAPDGPATAMLPSPGGGMSVERVADMVRMYGQDVVYLLGGSLLADPPNIHLAVGAMRKAVDAAES
ncbi:RuBisCO large subunit C-terminal-like domain-containing protein [Rhodobacter sp. 24-YEA-8]|uniref:RuBisCO large subunit C-terminal-like domain-containing protein n=1 Tax=Rhodobacter sp. 24-YEA-8 TaxID=1884310 RepID=UPI00089802F0|nr:RuBisCO large subunit C-terminal-like domain-containing protein [Rhodobacter sp. 24-YEA-8]SEC70320.1 ribulose-bisphosphate carboxylase large chain [Rhodobacter sp. 24-YEA-8]